jgi:hypothetical protein
MGEKCEHNSGSARVEDVSKNGQVHSKDREHIVELINMSLKDLWELAYQEGYKDGMSFVSDEEILKTVAY